MLLTSGQVSVAVSSSIVLLCTAALFLSGYVIQQRTLRDLREAIKPTPRPSPRMYLPDRFKQATTELEDGTIIVLHHGGGGEKVQREEPVIQVKPTTADDNPNEEPLSNDQRPSHEDKGDHDTDGSSVRQQLTTETKGGSKSKSKASKNGKGSESPQQPMSRAERRRRIKEEIMRSSQGQERGYYQRRLG